MLDKLELMTRIEKDTAILREQGLIDYSLFLIEVDRNQQIKLNNQNSILSLVFNVHHQ